MRPRRFRFVTYFAAVTMIVGCRQGARRVKQPHLDPQAAADEAISLYDADGDGELEEKELLTCPGILSRLDDYDADGSKTVSRDEIASRLANRAKSRVSMMSIKCVVRLNGKPLPNADVVFEPEPYLGSEFKTSFGTTSSAGMCSVSIPKEELPTHIQHLNAIHAGTYKVRITHPEISLPSKFNSETELGFETESGNMYAKFDLKLSKKR